MARTRAQASQAQRDGTLGPLEALQDAQSILGALTAPRPRKYKNKPCVVNGITFDSIREAERYAELAAAEEHGLIRDLEVHPRFPLVVHGIDCGAYEADFAYVTEDGGPTIEDVKSPSTARLPTYRLKRRLVWALFGIVVKEV